MSRLTKSDILKDALYEAMKKSLGIVTTACKTCSCSRDTYYEYYKTDEEFKARIDSIKDLALDFVETAHYKLIQEGNPSSIIFHLKTKGKNRGYQETLETTNTSTNINIQVEDAGVQEDLDKMNDM